MLGSARSLLACWAMFDADVAPMAVATKAGLSMVVVVSNVVRNGGQIGVETV